VAGQGNPDGTYDPNLPYGPTQVNQPLNGAAEGGQAGTVGATADSRRQAKLMLAWGFLLVGVALLLRSLLFSRPGDEEVAAAGIAEVESPIRTDLTLQKEGRKSKSRGSSRRKN
jgi:hypothetical protein